MPENKHVSLAVELQKPETIQAQRMKKGKDFESQTIAEYENDGWNVQCGGWPDLLCVKNGEIRFVECKAGEGNLRPHQKAMHKLLKTLGFTVIIASDEKTAI